MDNHDKSLKRKRLLSTSSEDHNTSLVGVSLLNAQAETISSTCYGTVIKLH